MTRTSCGPHTGEWRKAALVGVVVALGGVLALTPARTPAESSPGAAGQVPVEVTPAADADAPPTDGQEPDTDGASQELLDRGGAVFQANCAACHGTRAEGRAGDGVLAGPPLDDIDVAYLDLTIRTGRMPIAEPSVGVRSEQLGDADREALVAWATRRFGLSGTIPEVSPGDASRGQGLYVRNCAACHGAAAGGGISGANVQVPPLLALDGVAIASASRVGPFQMPAFDTAVLSDQDIDDVVAYLRLVADTPRTPAGVRELDQVTAALFAVALGLAAAVVVLITARIRRWHPREDEGVHAEQPFEPRV